LRTRPHPNAGETVVIYHTGDERQAVGLGTVERTAYPDPKKDNDKIIVIDIRAGARLPNPVRLDRIKADPRFADSPLVRMGRLSVVPLTDEQYAAILEMAGM
jgi:predicted RNA-binding protein with PUA-like domain